MGVKRVFFWVCIFLTDYPNREWLIVPDRYFGLRQWEVLFFFFFFLLSRRIILWSEVYLYVAQILPAPIGLSEH